MRPYDFKHESTRTNPLVWTTPLVGMVLFILAMGAFFFSLYTEDQTQAELTTIRDVELIRQAMRAQLSAGQERTEQVARLLGQSQAKPDAFKTAAEGMLADHPVFGSAMRVNSRMEVEELSLPIGRHGDVLHPLAQTLGFEASQKTFNTARQSRLPVFSDPFSNESGDVFVELHAPIVQNGRWVGNVVATVSLQHLLELSVADSFSRLYQVNINAPNGSTLVRNNDRPLDRAKFIHEVLLDPPGHGVKLSVALYSTRTELFSNMLAWTVLGLSVLIVWSFGLLYRNAKLRNRAERRLLAEAKFRRAMENSVVTGMRAIDMQGRITYVNPAFCKMTGFDEAHLVGQLPPFPYWPEEVQEKQQGFIDQILAGRAPQKGFEVLVQRRDGTRFDARMYVSPLVDADGKQSGWMTSMTDITEPRRIREELAAAHNRFVHILEELDAAVSVRSAEAKDNEFIFVNRLHREWFSEVAPPRLNKGNRRRLSPLEPFEWQSPSSQRWFEVRRRTISWVDGATVIMQVATDITSRKEAENFNRQQQEKLQFTSRLITLGELASSLAHELNQPLAAIRNYIMGCVNRLRNDNLNPEELQPILEKVNTQAQRAADVIRRIREFVKQQEPKLAALPLEPIVQDAIGFSELQARNLSCRIETQWPSHPVVVMADPVLIEQVLMNLIKNGMEAMENLEIEDPKVEISVHVDAEHAKIAVRDHGTGVPSAIRDKLFESFFTTKAEGMGMGLNICRSIIEYHHGQLWVEAPQTGVGSVFYFTLPLARTAASANTSTHTLASPS